MESVSSMFSQTSIEFNNKSHLVEIHRASEHAILMQIREEDSPRVSPALTLPAPFRSKVEHDRLLVVIRTLLTHDYLLTRKLANGETLEFVLSPDLPDANRKLTLRQEEPVTALPSDKVRPWLLPKATDKDLYSFQRDGVNWLLSGPKRLLADDMGLGKTVQAIFGMRYGFSEQLFQNVLVLCPKSLIVNWLKELAKWAPELIAVNLTPPARSVKNNWVKAIANAHVIVSNYEQVRHAEVISSITSFDLIVADEVHRLRNVSSGLTKGFKLLRHKRFWGLTGTPIERDLKDLATLMSLLDAKRFSVADATISKAALREKAKPYILRRSKTAVLKDLPEVIIKHQTLELLDSQKSSYRSVLSGRSCNGEEIKNQLHKLGELRRICDYDPISETSAKLDRILEDLITVQSAGEKAIVFSFIIEPLEVLFERSHKVVKSLFISGRMSGDERNHVIEKFKSDSTITTLFASTKVASEGLTLVEANHVFFINRWWNPSSNAQARDRVNRIGQKRTVFIHEYICTGTVEERIEELLISKNDLYDNVVGKLEELLIDDTEINSQLEGQ